MRSIAAGSAIIAAAAVLALPAVPANAAAPTKVWVSNVGVDNASCGAVTAPCATFQQAHDNVASGGEIGVLTPGDYGGTAQQRLTINKSVQITNDGTGEATIQVAVLGNGIRVQAGPGDVVGLRGLLLDGLGVADIGVTYAFGSALHIQNCVIRNFESPAGLALGMNVIPSGNNQLLISDTLIYNNGSGANSGGVRVLPTGTGNLNVVLDRVHLENNVRGLWVDGSVGTANGAHVLLRDSVASGNASDGIFATTMSGKAAAFLIVERTTVVNNAGSGIHANGPGATVLLSDSTISRNGAGVTTANSGQLISYGNNRNNNNLGPEGTATGFFGPF